MITLLDVLSAYLECRKRKRSTLNAINFELNALDNCVELWLDIINRRYLIGKSITFVVTKPKPREIFAASFRDRVVHHLLMARLNPLFEELFIDTTCNCRKGKGVFYGVKTLYEAVKDCSLNYTVNCYIARFDLLGFFMSINKDILWKKVESFIKERYLENDQDTILYLADMIIHHCPEKNCHRKTPKIMWDLIPPEKSLFCVGDNYGLPIGNLTSLIFANFYLDNFDHLMKDKFKYYGRYVDDFYVVTRDKKTLLGFIPFIKNYLLSTIGVTVHPNKTYIQDYGKGCDFIGSTVKGKLIYTGTRTIRNCYDTIKQHNKDKDITLLDHFICSLNSLFGFMRKERASYNLRSHISLLIDLTWYKYMEYTNKGIFKEKTNYRIQIKNTLKW